MSTPLNGSVLKAFSILGLFTPERPEISATSVASELGTNTATAHRFLLTLEEAGALVSYRRGYYCLGGAIEDLGRLAENTNPLAAKLQPVIADLAKDLHESVMVCRLGRKGPTCIAVASSDQPINVNISVGTILPMSTTAQGKLWLAHMKAQEQRDWLKGSPAPDDAEFAQIRSQGYARNAGDNEPDIGALAVPIPRGGNGVFLTLSMFGMLSRFNGAKIEKALPMLQATAERLRT